MSRPSIDEYMMRLAQVAASRTTCIKRSVGCVLADAKGRVLSIGYNGVASGMPHCNDTSENNYCLPYDKTLSPKAALGLMLADMPHVKAKDVLDYALVPDAQPDRMRLQFTWANNRCTGHDLPPGQDSCESVHAEQNALLQCRDPREIAAAYVTLSPCKPCVKLLMNTGCQRIVFLEEHADPWPKEQWLKLGREWTSLPSC